MTTQRVTSDRLAIEHLLPQQWETHWPVGTDPTAKAQRSQSVHLIGNLTLLTGRLNTKISHGPWAGEHGKWAALEKHDVLLLNRHVRQLGATGWDEQRIRHRTETLIDTILRIWPVPEGHAGLTTTGRATSHVTVGVLDLLTEGLLTAGQTLYGRGRHATATSRANPTATIPARWASGSGLCDLHRRPSANGVERVVTIGPPRRRATRQREPGSPT